MDSLESTGKILEQARKDQGKSIPEMEGLTKIRGRYLQALEQDQFSVLPGDVYVKGFLKTYANTLHLDGEAIVQKYKENLSDAPETNGSAVSGGKFPIPGRKAFKWRLLVALALMVGGAIVLFYLGYLPIPL